MAFRGDGSSSTVSRSNWNLEVLVFDERGKLEYPEKNLSGQSRKPTTNSTHIMTPGPGIEPGTHWWEASALTTVPTLLPCICTVIDNEFRHNIVKVVCGSTATLTML